MDNPTRTTPQRPTPLWVLVATVLILFALAVGIVLLAVLFLIPARVETSALPAPEAVAARPATPGEFLERNGIELLSLGVTAGGGLIDVRFRVVDAERASFLLDEASRPRLIAEESGALLTQHIRPEYKALESGRIYYLLFSNVQNAILPGSLVAVELGGLRLEHLVAR